MLNFIKNNISKEIEQEMTEFWFFKISTFSPFLKFENFQIFGLGPPKAKNGVKNLWIYKEKTQSDSREVWDPSALFEIFEKRWKFEKRRNLKKSKFGHFLSDLAHLWYVVPYTICIDRMLLLFFSFQPRKECLLGS